MAQQRRETLEHFTTEAKLKDLYSCLDDIQWGLRSVHLPQNANKRAKNLHSYKIRLESFKLRLNKIKTVWTKIMFATEEEGSLFHLLSNRSTYDEIAQNLIDTLHLSRNRYNCEEENLRLVLETLLIPIIGSIMDETEISESSQQRQKCRQDFILNLMNFRPSPDQAMGMSRRSSGEDEVLDVCSLETPQRRRNRENQERSASQPELSVQYEGQQYQVLDWFSSMALALLINAVSKHSQVVSKKDVDLFAEIYHVVNIVYIVEIIEKKFRKIKFDLISDRQMFECQDMTFFQEIWDKYDEIIAKCYDMFDAETTQVIFKNDLRNLLIQIRTFNPVMNK